jgi:opacity protein-like surface antigen
MKMGLRGVIRWFDLYTIYRILLFVAASFPCAALAQNPPVPAKRVSFDAAAGYSYINLPLAPGSRIGLRGADANFTVNFSPRVGFRVDFGYVRGGNVFGSGRHADVLSYMAGPVITLARGKRASVYLEGLVGAARVTGPVPDGSGGFLVGGFANKLAWAAGGGVEYRLSRSWALRAGADYLHTVYFSPAQRIVGQDDVRAITNIVYSFAPGRR